MPEVTMSTYIPLCIFILLASTFVNSEGQVRPKLTLDVAFRDLFGENNIAKSERENTISAQDKSGNLVAQLLELGSMQKRTQSNLGDTLALNGQLQQFYLPIDGQSNGKSADSLNTAVRDYMAKRGLDQIVWMNGLDAGKRATHEHAAESFNVFGELLEPLLKRNVPSQVERRGEIWNSDYWKRNTNRFQNENFYMPMTKKSNNDADMLWFPFKRSKFLEAGTAEESTRSGNPFYIPGGGDGERSLIDFPDFKRFSAIQGIKSFYDGIKRNINKIQPVAREQNSNFEDSPLFLPLISTGKEQKRNGQHLKSLQVARANARNEPLINAFSWFPADASRLTPKRSWRNPPKSELNDLKVAADDLSDNNDIWSLWGAKRSTESELNVKELESLLSKLNLHREAKNNRREAILHPLAKAVMSSLGNMGIDHKVKRSY